MILPIVSYADARESIATGDIACFRGDDLISRVIAQATGMPESHVAYLLWPGDADVLMVVEAWHPMSRAVEFSSRVQAASGRVDVYRLRPEIVATINLAVVTAFMLRATNVDYPENWLFNDAMHILFPSWPAVKPFPNSADPKIPRHCSGVISAAMFQGGLPRMKEFDCYVYPGDWHNLAIVQGLFTLTYP